MQIQTNTLEKHPRLYTIEFLRIFFVFFIILGHIMKKYPDVESKILFFFHTKEMHTWFGVEFFFIIGGFFLYKRIMTTPDIWSLIKKIYLRLFPALLFVFFLCVMSGSVKLYKIPTILSLTTGLTIPGVVTGYGDWYVGTYFWCSLLFIGLFSNNFKQGFLWTGVLSYFTLCLKFNAPYDGWMKTYYTIIGNQFIRGIYSMGIGIATAYLAEKVSVSDKKGLRFFFTLVEVSGLVLIFNYIARPSHAHLNFWEMEIVFSLWLICVAKSLGYISIVFNKMSKVQFVSRYSYPIFLGHIPFMKYIPEHGNFGLSPTICGLIIMVGGIMTGIFEYHFIEKKVIPLITKYFKKEGA